MKTAKKITPEIGMLVRDIMSGFTGVASGITIPLYGMAHVSVQAKVGAKEPAKLPELLGFDIDSVEVVDATIQIPVQKPVLGPVRLGDRVQDSLSDAVGTAYKRAIYSNGCVYYAVLSDRLHKFDGSFIEWFLPQQRLIVKNARKMFDLSFPDEHAVAEEEVKLEPPGGPVSRPMRQT